MQSTLKLRDTYAKLRDVNSQLDDLNKDLEVTVQKQVQEIEKSNRFKRFMAPQVVESLVSKIKRFGKNSRTSQNHCIILGSWGFTAYANSAEPDSLMNSLEHFHKIIGPVIFKHAELLNDLLVTV